MGETANWVESAPLRVILDTTRLAVPVLDTDTVFCENEPTRVESIVKTTGLTEMLGVGTGGGGVVDRPTPLKFTVCGVPAALWLNTSEADLVPAESGAKVTMKIWLEPAAMLAEVGRTEKRGAWVPLTITEETFNATIPELVTVKIFWEIDPTLVVSITSVVCPTPNNGTGGGALPIPVTLTESRPPAALWLNTSEADLVPAESGAKVTMKIWLEPAAMLAEVGRTEKREA